MMRRGFGRLARWAAYVVAVVLALVLAGDRGRAAAVPATIYGQDPLEVLELKVRPNVIVVLDSSGSMKWGATAPASPASNFYPPQAGDHPRSKIYQAKQVLKQIVTNNQDKVSFMFGQYNQNDQRHRRLQERDRDRPSPRARPNRFQYWTTDRPRRPWSRPQLTIQNDRGGSGGRGLQSWQLIYPAAPASGWNTFYYEETIGGTTHICTATIANGPRAERGRSSTAGGKADVRRRAGTFAADLEPR